VCFFLVWDKSNIKGRNKKMPEKKIQAGLNPRRGALFGKSWVFGFFQSGRLSFENQRLAIF